MTHHERDRAFADIERGIFASMVSFVQFCAVGSACRMLVLDLSPLRDRIVEEHGMLPTGAS